MSEGPVTNRGRGRGRGGVGKYLRARGRRGQGRPAVFEKRLVLEGEEEDEEDEEEEATERALKFSRRQLVSNADRYVEPEPELGSDGEPEVEPEVDLSSFLEKQRLSSASPSLQPVNGDEDDVDTTLAHITSRTQISGPSRKGKVEQIEWNDELEALSREKASAEATWDLKSRFRAKSERLRAKPAVDTSRKTGTLYVDAPALPLPDGSAPQPKNSKEEMEDFLDELLS